MADIVQALGDALNRDLAALNNVAQNLANVNTTGYKSSSVADAANFQNQLKFGEALKKVNIVQLNLSAGSLKQTKRSLDLAITGNAFFTLLDPQHTFYTRDGSFKINQQGVLVNSSGMPIKGQSGEIVLDSTQDIKIADDGSIYQNGNYVSKIEIVSFLQESSVYAAGNGLLQTPTDNLKEPESWTVHQGFIETSNVNSSQEMVRMMEISKHFESVQRALSIYDQALTSGITKLGQ